MRLSDWLLCVYAVVITTELYTAAKRVCRVTALTKEAHDPEHESDEGVILGGA